MRSFHHSESVAHNRRTALSLTIAIVMTAGVVSSCKTSTQMDPPVLAGTPSPRVTEGRLTPPLINAAWAMRTKEHVDLWLHSYALLSADTTFVPYFRRGYRERLNTIRKQRNVSSLLDANRGKLLDGILSQPELGTSGQFLPFYFGSWEQMKNVIDMFIRNNGNPGTAADPNMRQYFGLLGAAFPNAKAREWLKMMAESADDENRKFYEDYWTSQSKSHALMVAKTDSLWQQHWRPQLQRFLNNTQQQNGELYLSLPLGGEGRTVHFGKSENAIAVPMIESMSEAEIVLYVVAHEATGAAASAAIADNTTPADQRAGTASRYEQIAAVRAGAMLLERTIPVAVPGYMRFYLQAVGKIPPADSKAMFASTFALPDAIRDALVRQFDVILGGI